MEQPQMNKSSSADLTRGSEDQDFVDLIKSEMAEFSTAFSNVDLKTAASFFTEDAVLINPAGVRAVGREQIARVMQDDLNSFLKDGRSEFRYESSRMLSPDLAMVDLAHSARDIKAREGQQKSLSLHVATVMRREGNRWLMLECRPYMFMGQSTGAIH